MGGTHEVQERAKMVPNCLKKPGAAPRTQ